MIQRRTPLARRERFCSCGAKLFGAAGRCAKCQSDFRTEREAHRIPRELPKRPVRIDPNRNPQHLEWIRTLPCCVPGCRNRPSQAAHVRIGTGSGVGLKPPDRYTAPACYQHHHEQHQLGHRAFDAKYAIDMRAIAEQLAKLSPYL